MERIENLYKKYNKKKVYFALAIIIIIIHMIILNIAYQINLSFSIGGQKFKYVSEDGNIVFFKDKDGNPVSIDIKIRGNTPNLMGDKYEIKYKDKFIIVDHTRWQSDGIVITLSNGEEYREDWISMKFMETYRSIPFDVKFVNNINSIYDFVKDDSIYTLLLATIPAIFYSLANIMYPEKLWRIHRIFTVEGGKPTDWAISSSIFGGALFLLVILILPLLLLIK